MNGHNAYFVTPKIMYDNEMGKVDNEFAAPLKTKEKENKIGLMYASDYGYAASPSITNNWTTTVEDYDTNNIPDNNWMNMGLYEWTISRDSSVDSYAFYLSYNGGIGSSEVYESRYGIRPCFYLSSNVQIKSGDGSKDSPYRLSL